jgi:hypothetical protein
MSFISDTDKSEFKSSYKTFFDTFKEDIIIHKSGKVNVVDVNLTQLFGYDEPAAETNYTYNLESQTFSGLIIHPRGEGKVAELGLLKDVVASIPEGQIIIKVEEDCKNYLKTGSVKRIDIQNKSYTLISTESKTNKIIDGYFLFKLEETK